MGEEIIGGVAVLIAALVVPWYVHRQAREAKAYTVWQERFFQKLDSLIDSKDAPPAVVEIGLLLGQFMRERWILRRLVWWLLTGQLRKKGGPTDPSMRALSDRTMADTAYMFVAWIHALSYLSVFHGMLLRNIMFPLFKGLNGDEDKVEDAVVRSYCEAVITATKGHLPKGAVPA